MERNTTKDIPEEEDRWEVVYHCDLKMKLRRVIPTKKKNTPGAGNKTVSVPTPQKSVGSPDEKKQVESA